MTKAKKKGEGLATSFSESYKTLLTLVKMQLKEKLDTSYLQSKRAIIFKVVWLFIEFAAITALIAVAFYFLKLMNFFSLVHDIPVSVISIAFTVMLFFSLIADTLGLMKSLYFSKDNTVLLTFPATPSLVFFSKLVVYYVYRLRQSFMYMVPMFIAYGIIKGYSPIYYPWLLLMFLLISTVPVLIAALLSIPSMFISVFLNRFKIIQYALYATATVLGVFLLLYLIGLIPDNINFVETWGETYWEIQAFLRDYIKTFPVMYAFTELIVGKTVGLTSVVFHSETLINLAYLVVLAIVLLVLCFICSKPLFCRMASTPFEFKKKNAIKEKSNVKHGPFASAIKKEFNVGLRSGTFTKLGAWLVIAMPMAIFLLNKLYAAMNTRHLGTQMTICFSVMIMLLILMMTNIDIASVYSRDGSSSYLNKVQPASYTTLLISKLVFPMIIAFVGTVFTVSLFALEAAIKPLDAIMIGLLVYAVYIAHLFTSAESDIMNPQYEQYATFNEQANNPNETASGVSAIIFAIIVFIIALFFTSRADASAWIKVAAIAVVFAAFKGFTYVSKIKAFYKEKQ